MFCNKTLNRGMGIMYCHCNITSASFQKETSNVYTKMVKGNCLNHLRIFMFQIKLSWNFCSVSLQNTLAYIMQSHPSETDITACIHLSHTETMYFSLVLCITFSYDLSCSKLPSWNNKNRFFWHCTLTTVNKQEQLNKYWYLSSKRTLARDNVKN